MKVRFDTRDKKPKLWHVLTEAVFVVALSAFLIWDNAEEHAMTIGVLLSAFFLAAVVQLMIAFFRQIQYNPYSYNTIYYMGFALFTAFVLLTQIAITAQMASLPGEHRLRLVLSILQGSAKNYMLITAPFLLVFSAALCVSNISLIRHEGKRLVNVLGIILSFLLVAGQVVLFLADYSVSGSQFEVMLHDIVTNLFAAAYLYFECMLIGVIAAFAIVSRYEPEPDKDFVVILGCGLRKDGTPSPLLRGRCDRAVAFAAKQREMTGKELTFVTSGGQGPDEVTSESAAMKRYLMDMGVLEERILEEDRSTNTRENMRFSKEKILAVNPKPKVAFSTTNYHVFRSGLYARRVKMRAVGMGAKTKWYFWPNAAVREFVGLLTEHKLKQALVFGGMLIFYVAVTIIAYS